MPVLKGIDLREYAFREGWLYEVDATVARVLLSSGYAERHPKPVTPKKAGADREVR
jgi:hypothetical protein